MRRQPKEFHVTEVVSELNYLVPCSVYRSFLVGFIDSIRIRIKHNNNNTGLINSAFASATAGMKTSRTKGDPSFFSCARDVVGSIISRC